MTENDDDGPLSGDGHPGAATTMPPEWTAVPDDPAPSADLGYEAVAWEEISVADESERVLYVSDLPERRAGAAYLLAEAGLVCDLTERR